MEPFTISYAEALETLTDLALENPDRTYEQGPDGCMYFELDGSPSCIVGHLFARRGYTYPRLLDAQAELNQRQSEDPYGRDRSLNTSDIDHLVVWGALKVDDATETLLEVTQTYQDEGTSWADALEQGVKAVMRRDWQYD